jgi:hypothetical protein
MKTKKVEYTYDEADTEAWAIFYGCPPEHEDKEAWAEAFVKAQVVELLTKPFKAQIDAQIEAERAAAMAQLDSVVQERVSVEDVE